MQRLLFTVVSILSVSVIASAQGIFYFAHVVNGVQSNVVWKTTILLTNPGTTPTSGVVSFSADNSNPAAPGSPMTLTMTDENGQTAASNSFSFSLPPNGTRRLISDGGGALVSGFATVIHNSGRVGGTAIFSEFD